MGANLVSYMVIGPVKLRAPKALCRKMLKRAEMIVSTANQALKDPGFDWMEDKLIGCFEYEDLNTVACLDPELVLTELMSMWKNNAGFADTNARVANVGKKKLQLLVAGDSSYGDEPDGEGYITLRDADRLGFLKALGIL